MNFDNPNIYFVDSGFGIRWTLIAFIFINLILLVYILIKRMNISVPLIHNLHNVLLPSLIYLSTIPIYSFRHIISDNGNSFIYKSAEHLISIESLVVIALIATLIYGLSYKNSYTFINIYLKALAVLEIIYILSYYITSQVNLGQWFNWVGAVLLGILFVALNRINIKTTQAITFKINPHNSISRYDSLFLSRKYQADEIVDIIGSNVSESGYSICINGEWGIGKTSLANGVLDKLKMHEKTSKNSCVDIFEIRINSMELDDSISLINYFFKKVKEILIINKIYVGIASEYKELVASISGTIIHTDISDFLTKKFSNNNSDYRENIERLSQLLTNNLNSSRILIIIDDIDRCSGEKAKSFLFLMKEIATMNRCITLFLADIGKLKVACNLDESFFEKFFNHMISLSNVCNDEIFASRKDTSIGSSIIFEEIEKMSRKFDEKIVKAEKELYLYIQNHNERREYKEMRITSIKEDKKRFLKDLSNPRRVEKVIEYFERLIQQVNKQKLNCPSEKQKSVDLYLTKVDYKKQLFILSIIYGLYNIEFIFIQKNGVYSYIGDFAPRFKLAEPTDGSIHSVDALIMDEWYYLQRTLSSDFKIQEKLRFVNCVLTNIEELLRISNGYNSVEENYISIIRNGKLPDDIAFSELIPMIYSATYDRISQRDELIKIIFVLYDKKMVANSVDAAFDLFSNNKATNYFSSDTPILQMFSNTFCTNNNYLNEPKIIGDKFVSFANTYLWHCVTILSRYFLPISPLERVSYKMWDSTNESVLVNGSCEDMLKAYCVKCESLLDFSDDNTIQSSILRLNSIVNKVNLKYIDFGMEECWDVLQACENVKKMVAEIVALFKIECFINNCNTNVNNASFNIRNLSTDNLYSTIETLSILFSECIEYRRNDDIQTLLQFICGSEQSITFSEYEKLSRLVEKYFKEHHCVASWRQMLIYIKVNKVIKCS